ncbi:MAG: EAL domain-containing protein [Cyanobacteria bacterium P01_D01_bin.156]
MNNVPKPEKGTVTTTNGIGHRKKAALSTPSTSGQTMKSLTTLSSSNYLGDLSALVQHELKHPLSSLQGVVQRLSSGRFGKLSGEGNHLLMAAMMDLDRLIRLANAVEAQPSALSALLSPEQVRLFKLKQDLPIAIEQKEIYLVYQPIVCNRTSIVYGFEALARWDHPTYGEISPTVFIPLAEEDGLIHQMGKDLITKACNQLSQWQRAFPQAQPLTMSVNLSPLQLGQLALADHVEQVLQSSNVDPSHLKLEITESALVENSHIVTLVLQKLRDLGIRLHLDDFGTGYSALSRLKSLPLNALKVDRSFVVNQNWDICEIIYALAEKLSLSVIVEGIESREDVDMLKEIGFQYMQGYYFSRPLRANAVVDFLSKFYPCTAQEQTVRPLCKEELPLVC